MIAKLKIVFIVILTLNTATGVYAQFGGYNHPELKWETIETEHFQLHFHQGIDRTPYIVARIAEEIYEPITQLYQYIPDEKVHFIFQDTEDISGGATYYYDNMIIISSAPMDFALRGTTNWLRNVVTHEFAHMIHLQRARKTTRHTPGVFFQWLGYEKERRSDVVYGFPNVIMSYPVGMTVIPNWFAEGVAQYTANLFGYDHWDAHRDMIIRMRVENDNLLSLNQMGSFGKNSIGNESVYNQGFSLVQFIAEEFGEDKLEKLTRAMQKLHYFTFGMAIRKVLNISESELFKRWENSLKEKYTSNTQTIRKHEVKGEIIQSQGFANLYPTWSPDGRQYLFLSNKGSDYLSMTSLYLSSKDGGKPKHIKAGVRHNPAWFGDGSGFVYIKAERTSTGSYYNDLFLYELNSAKSRRLTFGQRAFCPAISPEGRYIAYAKISDGTFNIMLLETATGDIKQITDFNDGRQIFKLAWTPDGQKIIFSTSRDATRNIASIKPDGSSMKMLLEGECDFRDPALSADGKYLYFSSNETGIFNIYRMELPEGKKELITNVLGGAFMPSVNKDGDMLFSQYTNEGYLLTMLQNPSPVDKSFAVYAEYIPPKAEFNDLSVPKIQSKPYKTSYTQSTIIPRIMLDYKRPKLGVTGYASDYLNQYSFLGALAVNSILDYDAFLELEYRKYKPTFFLDIYGISRRLRVYFPPEPEINQPGENDQIRFSLLEVDLGATYRLSDTQILRGMFAYSRYRSAVKNLTPIPGIPNRVFGYNYLLGKKLELEWQYKAELKTFDGEINPSAGRDLSIRVSREHNKFIEDFTFDERIGAFQEVYKPYNYNSVYVNWKEYYPLPIGVKRNTLSLNVQAAVIDRSVDSFFYFFGGGLPGIKGYSYYSIEGRKMLINSLTYRAPIFMNIDKRIGPWNFDKLYGGVTYFWGNAWSEDDIPWDKFKRSIDFQLRLDAFSFYSFPTRIAFDAAYGLDGFENLGGRQGKEWRFYLQILFDYLF